MTSKWEKFNYKKWDEPGFIYCDKCGLKNRSDSGWYRRERVFNLEFENMKKKMSLLYPHMPEFQTREYCCNYCWGHENHQKRKCSVCNEIGHTKNKCLKKEEKI